MKKLLIVLTVAMFMFSSLAYARGGSGNGGKGNCYSGTMGSGSSYQNRIQNQNSSEKGSAESNGKGDLIRTKSQKRDESCN